MDNRDAMNDETLKHLFQQEFSKMVAVIARRFGLQHIEVAEDIVSDTFVLAMETWPTKGFPSNPAAWLYTVAKQKTLYHFRRNKIFDEKIVPELTARSTDPADLNFSEQHIKDSQLQMLFAVCHPIIAAEAQMGLALRILCGFSIDAIADAFLTHRETINKRLFRAKEKLRAGQCRLEMPPENEILPRLSNVLHVIYLLFSEGYYSRTHNDILRKDLCLEAMRLAVLLTEYDKTNLPKTNALLAMMCFHASRFDARQPGSDFFVVYDDQDEALWNQELIRQGLIFLERSAQGEEISSYHLEARIGYWHCIKKDSPEKWEEILKLYTQLLAINYSPSVALNRTYALYKVCGRDAALREAERLNLDGNHFYFVLLGELYSDWDPMKATIHFEKAWVIAKTLTEKNYIRRKIDRLN